MERHSEFRTGNIVFIAVHDGPKSAGIIWKPARENSVLHSRSMRLPIRTATIVCHRPLDGSETQRRFGIVRMHAIPKAREIFENGISLPVEESVLQAVGLIAGEAIGHTDGMTRLQPFGLADHGNEWILF